jgi:ethanolamine utilization protein EutN
LVGGRWRVVVPLSLEELHSPGDARAEPLVTYDELGAGIGSLIAVSEGAEAAQPFYPDLKPIDAYAAALLDRVDVPAAR